MNIKIARFFQERRPATPCLVVDLDVVSENYRTLAGALPDSLIYYAVKANPAPEVLSLLAGLGSSFDTASLPEIRQVLAAGATADRISFGNTIKKQSDIAAAYALGVRLFAFDSIAELEKIAAAAPGSKVFCRILTSGEGADWPLSRKFGCDPEMARDLLLKAASLGVEPYGVSFHVGSQQRDLTQWDAALATVAGLFRELEEKGVTLRMVNLGGGFPTRYRRDVPPTEAYGEAIRDALRAHFGNRLPATIVEPGRGMVGNAGVIESEVVLISRKSANDNRRWVYLDIGKFGGLAETMDEAIQYPIETDAAGPEEAVILAGPTCDSADVLYEKADYHLPVDLRIGDRIRVLAAGAYTTTYASVAFNGFEPLAAYYI
ncbi:type III PLP-dependent enzyme [Inquilinus sp. CAU 1745]|uniref:type III PLP-dependent enzyme n=1 Tax=Inquilinus sp. CAU 1745 TaxID=3140369 RepID=UPI00325B7A6C